MGMPSFVREMLAWKMAGGSDAMDCPHGTLVGYVRNIGSNDQPEFIVQVTSGEKGTTVPISPSEVILIVTTMTNKVVGTLYQETA